MSETDRRSVVTALCALATEMERTADLHAVDYWQRLERQHALRWASDLRAIAEGLR